MTGAQEFDLSERDFPDYTVPGPVLAEWTAALEGSVLKLRLEITAAVEFCCARCLAESQRGFQISREYPIREQDCTDPQAELPFAPNGRLDLEELCYQELVMEVPSVLLCSDDCAGLCPVCGRRNPCACTQETNGDVVDERLAILKTLL